MRGASRRTSELLLVSPVDSFAWSPSLIATLRHCSLPWYDAAGPPISIAATPITTLSEVGTRDQLSLVAQFAAHQAFLQFVGIADGDFDRAEWAVVRKRGHDCRLIRIAARGADLASAPPALSLVQAFGDALGAPALPAFQRSWARPESAYAEVDELLRSDAAADSRWMRRSACGEIRSPGPEALRQIWSGECVTQIWSDPSLVESLAILGALDRSRRVVRLGCEFPLQRYGALAAIDAAFAGSDASEASVAENMAAAIGEERSIALVEKNVDHASRRAIEIASAIGIATWLIHGEQSDLPSTRWFVLAPRVAARLALERRIALTADPRPWIERFVESDSYRTYLHTGEVPVDDAFSSLAEPRRSYVAALALIGTRVRVDVARRFLAEFLFDQPLDDLCLTGITRVEDDHFGFQSEAIREQCSRHIPSASRGALCRAAAAAADPRRAAFLMIEAGDISSGRERLEALEWSGPEEIAEQLARIPAHVLTPALARTLGNAYVECGRYRDAASVSPLLDPAEQDLLLARCDRRSGDYDTALARLERLEHQTFASRLLRAEILRVCGRLHDADAVVRALDPEDAEARMQADYERSLLRLENAEPVDAAWTNANHYLSARFLTYRALTDSDFASAEQLAREALRLARSPIERIDAWLDLVFATFSAGRWSDTRSLGLEALEVIGETQGDRAAAGILFTLTYLAADHGQWRSAEAMLQRLRVYYAAVKDIARLFELKLLEAHLDFSRGRFSRSRQIAQQVLERDLLLPQVREAAALIVDEVNLIGGVSRPLCSTGGSGNRELADRHCMMAARSHGDALAPADPFNAALTSWILRPHGSPPQPATRSESLKLMRAALAAGKRELAARLADELGAELDDGGEPAQELSVLRLAATAEYPFDESTFGGRQWIHATRNRLGQWNAAGNIAIQPAELDRQTDCGGDWMRSGDREVLFIAGSAAWPAAIRDAVAAVFRTRAENHRLRRLVEQEEAPQARVTGAHGIVGESPAITAVLESIARVSRRDVPVCILGESGTGKELVARAIHRESGRRQKAIVAVNCAALPENLVESELFGHVRGAFTGADRDRAGLIETSDGGTLFLDEIGELPLVAQAKLLRFLQDGEFRRVGESVSRTSDVRVISATNRGLEAAVDEGQFREDLYYRIRGVEIAVPPLRERGNDVALLARHFLAAEQSRHRGGASSFSIDVESLFRSYRWPGNVRELQNTVRAAHAMAGDVREIAIEHLPERLRSVVPTRVMAGSYQDAVARFRRDLIERSLLEADGNQNRAAALLNMSRQALAYQIRELGILVRKRPGGSV